MQHGQGRDRGESNREPFGQLPRESNRHCHQHVIRTDAPEPKSVWRLRRQNRIGEIGVLGIIDTEPAHREHADMIGIRTARAVKDECETGHQGQVAVALRCSAQCHAWAFPGQRRSHSRCSKESAMARITCRGSQIAVLESLAVQAGFQAMEPVASRQMPVSAPPMASFTGPAPCRKCPSVAKSAGEHSSETAAASKK